MASANLTINGYKHYNGGWSSWSSTRFYGGYSGSTSYAAVLRFTTPDKATYLAPYTFNLKFPWVRQSSAQKSGTFTVYLFTSDPTGTYTPTNISSSTTHVASGTANWSATDLEIHYTEVSITLTSGSIPANSNIYFWIANNVNFLEIGYSTLTASNYTNSNEYVEGAIWIYKNSTDKWVQAIPYVYKNSTDKWVQAIPYIYKNSTDKWVPCG